jgi:hypothetical protein
MTHPGDDVRRQHMGAVLSNQLLLAERWAQPCRAYHVCVRPGAAAAAELAGRQAIASRLEPSLLRVPERAMHANLLWLLPVHQESGPPKEELWRRHGPRWLATLADAAAATGRFRLTFRRLVATNSAIIAVADEPNGLGALRRQLAPLLHLPGGSSAGRLAHITLFRYATPLRGPAALLRWFADDRFCAEVDVRELLVIHERVYPSLDVEILRRLPLAGTIAPLRSAPEAGPAG